MSMKSKYISPETEMLDCESETVICSVSTGQNESFIEKPGGGFDM